MRCATTPKGRPGCPGQASAARRARAISAAPTQVMRGTLILGGLHRLCRAPCGRPFSLSPGAFESPYQGLSIEHPLASSGATGAERGAPENPMFCAMRNFGAPRWRGGDAPLRPNGPYGALTSAPLGLVVRRLGER